MTSDVVNDMALGASSSNPDLRWYVVHAYSGMEKAVERNITERIARAGMQGHALEHLVAAVAFVDVFGLEFEGGGIGHGLK